MKQRVITAFALAVPASAAIFILPTFWFGLLLLPVLWLAAREWAGLSGAVGRGAYTIPALATALGLLWLATSPDPAQAWISAPLASLPADAAGVFWLVFAAVLIFTRAEPRNPGGAAVGGLLIWAAFVALLLLHAASSSLAFVALMMICASDIGAFFAGRRFGGPRLAPRISPGKTRSGLAGGLLAGLIAGGLFAWVLPVPVHNSLGFVIGALTALLAGVAGDLAVSVLKRRAGVKDSGSSLPGHGGMLDRLDSGIAALPVFVFMHSWWM